MDKQNVIGAALLGYGTVGSGVYLLASRLGDELIHKTGASLEIRKILVRSLGKKREGADPSLFTDNWKEILEDDGIQIVIELMGGIEPARTYVSEALKAGKQVVTANKDLLAEHGGELLELASSNGCDLMFEASVAGAVPIIRALKQSLAGAELTEVAGIVNGTTNYVLTKMSEVGMDYKEALELAMKKGYAEADPTADVEGYDAGRKIAIMASIAFNSRVTFSQVSTEGITGITAKDIQYARDFGYVIKLLGIAKKEEDGIEVKVHPMLVPEDHPLASVRSSFNAVFVRGDACDEAMFMGRGAGKMPTASAVMGDVIDVIRNMQYGCTGRIGCTCYRTTPVKNPGDIKNKFFIRMQVVNKPGVLAAIAGELATHKVSISKVVQKVIKSGMAELVIGTEEVKEYHMADALNDLKKLDVVHEISSVIREY